MNGSLSFRPSSFPYLLPSPHTLPWLLPLLPLHPSHLEASLPCQRSEAVYSCLGGIPLPILASFLLHFTDISILFLLCIVFSIGQRWNEVLGCLIAFRSGMDVSLPWAEICQRTNSVLICVAVDSVITTQEGVLRKKDWRAASANLKCCCLLTSPATEAVFMLLPCQAVTFDPFHVYLCVFISRGVLLSKCMKVNSKLCICFKFSGSWEDVTSAWYTWGILEGPTCLSFSYHSFCPSSSLVPLTFDPAAWQDCSRLHCLML